MTEINRPKLNLSALKGNKQSTPETPKNQEKKASINTNTGNLSIPKITKPTPQGQKPNISINDTSTQKINTEAKTTKETENKNIEQKIEKNNQIKTEENIQNNIKQEKKDNEISLTKSSLQETILKKEEELLKTENKQQINENGEIFSGYTSDFANKEEEALKESKEVKLPDSPKKVFFAIFTSLLILSSLALVIIFKVDKPVTNKIKANILELIGKAEKKPAQTVKTETKESWEKSIYNSLGFSINYEKSNKGKYKIDGKILNNKNEFDKYIKNKIEKLKIEKLKKHLQEEKVAN